MDACVYRCCPAIPVHAKVLHSPRIRRYRHHPGPAIRGTSGRHLWAVRLCVANAQFACAPDQVPHPFPQGAPVPRLLPSFPPFRCITSPLQHLCFIITTNLARSPSPAPPPNTRPTSPRERLSLAAIPSFFTLFFSLLLPSPVELLSFPRGTEPQSPTTRNSTPSDALTLPPDDSIIDIA